MPRTALLFWGLVFAGHLAAAAIWWWIMPGGFPLGHLRFWANTGLPAIVGITSLLGLVGLLRINRSAGLLCARFAAFTLFFLWASAGIATLFVFPASRKLPVVFALLASLPLLLGTVRLFRRMPRVGETLRRAGLIPALAAVPLGLAIGIALPWTQRGPEADTHPVNASHLTFPQGPAPAGPSIALCDSLTVEPASAALQLRRGPLRVEIQPLLTFHSRSADRFWTSLAKPSDRFGPPRELIAAERRTGGLSCRYRADDVELLDVSCSGQGATSIVDVTAWCVLPRDVYSHLNSYTEMNVSGHKMLSMRFSPCADTAVDVLPSDYPVGRPLRFACFDGVGQFFVVEATSGEKGPFRRLAAGALKRGDPLTITLCDDGRAACSITLLDFTSQCGAQLSPTAGWGIPVNAIEFTRNGDAETASASIWITLASTSVGRGWDSVGHGEGIYRNRLRVE